jgi:hypothetical protein
MPVFSVGVRRKSILLTAFSGAQRAYIVEAETERKAKNVVGRYLKSISKDDACDVWDAIPAEHLPATARESRRP